jgi:hypothetical protein
MPQTGIGFQCQSGTPYYDAWWEEYANNADQQGIYDTFDYSVTPGDSFTGRVAWNAGTSLWDMTLTNVTARWTVTSSVATTAGFSSGDSVEVITEAPSSADTGEVLTLPRFDKVTYSSVSITGGAGAFRSNVNAMDMVQAGVLMVKTSAYVGAGFVTKRV